MQTVVLRHKKDVFVPDKIGALFFGGEIITEAEDMPLSKARETIAQYIDNADIPLLITSDFENCCGSMVKGLTPLPATLSKELIENLLKKEMGFEGIVVTDALDMGGFLGWYKNKRQSQIESFKAGCDMML